MTNKNNWIWSACILGILSALSAVANADFTLVNILVIITISASPFTHEWMHVSAVNDSDQGKKLKLFAFMMFTHILTTFVIMQTWLKIELIGANLVAIALFMPFAWYQANNIVDMRKS